MNTAWRRSRSCTTPWSGSSTLTKQLRLDAELLRRGLAPSRAAARTLIEQGKVTVVGLPTPRAASLVDPAAAISLVGERPRFVSRGGDKLDGALRRFEVTVEGRGWLDAGASTGGFTDRLLQGGAAGVIAVDVGYGQLDLGLRNDPRVTVLERTNVRHLSPATLPWVPEGVVADLSFISLKLVLPALTAVAGDGADHVLLVKPQFEAGRTAVGKGGVVRDPGAWLSSLQGVARAAAELGLGLVDATVASPPGPAGNREFFVHLRGDGRAGERVLQAAVAEAAR